MTIMRQLMILRHAKSDWQSDANSDFDRPLAKRGKKDAPRVGSYLAKHNLTPDYVIASPAKRTKQTAKLVCEAMKIPSTQCHFDEAIYLASLDTLLSVLAIIPESANRVMLIGHNPGMDELLLYLAKQKPPRTDSGKLMTTAACALLDIPGEWKALVPHCAELKQLIRPKEL